MFVYCIRYRDVLVAVVESPEGQSQEDAVKGWLVSQGISPSRSSRYTASGSPVTLHKDVLARGGQHVPD